MPASLVMSTNFTVGSASVLTAAGRTGARALGTTGVAAPGLQPQGTSRARSPASGCLVHEGLCRTSFLVLRSGGRGGLGFDRMCRGGRRDRPSIPGAPLRCSG